MVNVCRINNLFERDMRRKENTCYLIIESQNGKYSVGCFFIVNQCFILLTFQGIACFDYFLYLMISKNTIDKNDLKTCVTSYQVYFQFIICCFI